MHVTLLNRTSRWFHFFTVWLVVLLLGTLVLAACQSPDAEEAAQNTPTDVPSETEETPDESTDATPAPEEAEEVATMVEGDQPVQITGTFEYTNDIIVDYYVEHAVALIDMNGFVERDQEWEIPVESQVLGYLDITEEEQVGEYQLLLPARPVGTFVDVDNDDEDDTGVQVYVVSYWPNLTGGPFSVGDDLSEGWPAYLASTTNDTENQDEVTGGKLVIWAADDQQEFPTGFGEDELLFTEDDPVGPVPAGYSVIDLDQEPFAVEREAAPSLTLYEPTDVAIKDFSANSYSEAFDQMFEIVRREYAFNGIEGKEPDWEPLYEELAPRVADAEENEDPTAFYLALRDFAFAFQDGHVGLNGGEIGGEIFQAEAGGGYGFAVRQLDDDRVIVTFVTEEGPAAQVGMEVGAEVTEFNGQPVTEAIAEIQPLAGPFSTDFAREYQQQRYLTRAALDMEAAFTFTNPDGARQTETLTAVPENESFSVTSLFRGADPTALPVEFEILPSGIGYVKINSNYDDLNLIVRLFERALSTFEQVQVLGVIIDMRQNSGGASLDLAGFLTDEPIPLGQREYYSEATGAFEPDGPPREVVPKENQYRFDNIVLLVDQACFSACEFESYGFSQVPDIEIIGQYPSAGVMAEVARGQFRLPENMSFQVPTGRVVLPDGSIFLEGVGVEPTQRIPITEETALLDAATVVQIAEEAILAE
ncbi:MAG: peptidase S41 [Chloroflexi bacterium AL-W]|nr:peptidase S41 [Chloroflexi bacterium AL-N1]NOK71444.1 peptidase S41 [Chloroflexi bacterium AL-N10]NOK78847.1 peptidase S41 [Chloroflexi bacterium AL-N5]NOK86265.1 peptidase S41 [Chloroflexi bacterium AL-W]NOK93169.1 peptidase S41 [Chloroflexi bacterium AL-N15]